MSQSDTWLLIFMVEKKHNKWLFEKQHFHCSPAMSKLTKFAKKWFWHRIKIFVKFFKGLAVLSVCKKAFSAC